MNAAVPTVRLADYRRPAFLIPEVVLDIDLQSEDEARVAATLSVQRNPDGAPSTTLVLDLDEVSVESVAIDGKPLPPGRWQADARHLTVQDVPASFRLDTVSRIHPRQNTKLMGIYTSSTGFFSLCEAE